MTEQRAASVLAARAEWYRSGCDGVKDRAAYLLNELAADAAEDLASALTLLQASEAARYQLRHVLSDILMYVEQSSALAGRPAGITLSNTIRRALAADKETP